MSSEIEKTIIRFFKNFIDELDLEKKNKNINTRQTVVVNGEIIKNLLKIYYNIDASETIITFFVNLGLTEKEISRLMMYDETFLDNHRNNDDGIDHTKILKTQYQRIFSEEENIETLVNTVTKDDEIVANHAVDLSKLKKVIDSGNSLVIDSNPEYKAFNLILFLKFKQEISDEFSIDLNWFKFNNSNPTTVTKISRNNDLFISDVDFPDNISYNEYKMGAISDDNDPVAGDIVYISGKINNVQKEITSNKVYIYKKTSNEIKNSLNTLINNFNSLGIYHIYNNSLQEINIPYYDSELQRLMVELKYNSDEPIIFDDYKIGSSCKVDLKKLKIDCGSDNNGSFDFDKSFITDNMEIIEDFKQFLENNIAFYKSLDDNLKDDLAGDVNALTFKQSLKKFLKLLNDIEKSFINIYNIFKKINDTELVFSDSNFINLSGDNKTTKELFNKYDKITNANTQISDNMFYHFYRDWKEIDTGIKQSRYYKKDNGNYTLSSTNIININNSTLFLIETDLKLLDKSIENVIYSIFFEGIQTSLTTDNYNKINNKYKKNTAKFCTNKLSDIDENFINRFSAFQQATKWLTNLIKTIPIANNIIQDFNSDTLTNDTVTNLNKTLKDEIIPAKIDIKDGKGNLDKTIKEYYNEVKEEQEKIDKQIYYDITVEAVEVEEGDCENTKINFKIELDKKPDPFILITYRIIFDNPELTNLKEYDFIGTTPTSGILDGDKKIETLSFETMGNTHNNKDKFFTLEIFSCAFKNESYLIKATIKDNDPDYLLEWAKDEKLTYKEAKEKYPVKEDCDVFSFISNRSISNKDDKDKIDDLLKLVGRAIGKTIKKHIK